MTISELKFKAREVLKKSYLQSILVSFILIIVNCGMMAMADMSGIVNKTVENHEVLSSEFMILLDIFIIIGVVILVITAKVFLANPMKAGHNSFYIKTAEGEIDLNHIGDGFQNRYMNCAKTMFLYDILRVLWSILFIVPGIMKHYEYFMVEYIIAENPYITSSRAFEISRKTMDGEKYKAFILTFPFMIWILLASFVCYGIGLIFILPYYYSITTQFYIELREKAIEMGYADYSDFSMKDYKYTGF